MKFKIHVIVSKGNLAAQTAKVRRVDWLRDLYLFALIFTTIRNQNQYRSIKITFSIDIKYVRIMIQNRIKKQSCINSCTLESDYKGAAMYVYVAGIEIFNL